MWVTRERSDLRQPLQLPLHFRILNATPPRSIVSETSNISPSGIFIHTPVRLKVGTPLSLSIRIPMLTSAGSGFNFRCKGRVVHEQQFVSGEQGYGVQFERPTARSDTAESVTSEEVSPTYLEKRTSRRHLLGVGVRFRCLEEGFPDVELSAETLNFSWHGVFLASRQVMKVGSLLSIRLETKWGGCEAGQNSGGRIIHRQNLPDGRIGYGIQIEKEMLRLATLAMKA